MTINETSKASSPAGPGLFIWLFAVTIFLSAFLLFQVQPIMAKYILPWFGGTPAVWTTCMLVFQVLLLAGYGYAHFISRFRSGTQVLIHISLITLSLFSLPITPSEQLRPAIGAEPTLSIIYLLALTTGLPYILLSATGPLFQKWFSNCVAHSVPYRLYALSNAGSLLALVSYPFLVEPLYGRAAQTSLWSWLLAVFALLCTTCAIAVMRTTKLVPSQRPQEPAISDSVPANRKRYIFWLAFPAIACIELLAVTSKITQDIAAIPLLWILPLAIYLVTFIICFDSPRWYKHTFYTLLLILAIAMTVVVRMQEERFGLVSQIGIYSLLLFACAMLCHGQLYHLRPNTRELTGYYLMISAGGALGGFFVAILAPLVFQSYLELNLGLLGCIMLTIMADINNNIPRNRRYIWAGLISLVGLIVIIFARPVGVSNRILLDSSRNFFGVLTLWQADIDKPGMEKNILQHGTTYHGIQFLEPSRRSWPTAYYGRSSGVGLAFDAIADKPDRKVGIVGLGVGTVATYSKAGDYLTFYEINPAVQTIAEDKTRFTFLTDCKGKYQVLIGDARLVMEQQQAQGYDLLIVDAFSSDSVPVHLLTEQAMAVYLKHLAPEGIIAFHLSNNHLKLPDLVLALADHCQVSARWIEDDGDEHNGTLTSSWVLLANNPQPLDTDQINAHSRTRANSKVRIWTDDHANLFEIIK